jgi:VanZ family protein
VRRRSRSGAPDKDERIARLLLAQRALSLITALVVAVVTLLPKRTEREMAVLAEGRHLGSQLGDVLMYVVLGLLGLAVIAVAWRSRLAARLKVSWPLLLVAIVYLVGLVALASRAVGSTVFGLIEPGMGVWLRGVFNQLDAEHTVAYAALTIIVVLAWRQKVALWWLVPGLFAYGYVLELLQELVPGREYGLTDLAANGLGIVIGLVGILLLDLLADLKSRNAASARSTHTRRRSDRHQHGRSPRPGSGRSREASRAATVTQLAGLQILVTSVLGGSLTELRLSQVGARIFGQFGAPYAFTFWLGALVMLVGGLRLRAARRVTLPR